MILGKKRSLSLNTIEAYACNCACAFNCSCSCLFGWTRGGNKSGLSAQVYNRNSRGASGAPKK